jgi:Zn-dependent protease with chaperone function
MNKIIAGSYRHEKESFYYGVAVFFAGLAWLFLIWVALLFIVPVLFLLMLAWWVRQHLKVEFYGNAVRVSENQFQDVYRALQEMAARLELKWLPEVFVVSGQGSLNALAIRLFRSRFILLHGELIDILFRSGAHNQLLFVIGHELAHHALGHTSPLKNAFLWPARFVPFLGPAYSRAQELSADRLGADCAATRLRPQGPFWRWLAGVPS